MSSVYTGISSFLAENIQITIPADGDPISAASVNVALEALADGVSSFIPRSTTSVLRENWQVAANINNTSGAFGNWNGTSTANANVTVNASYFQSAIACNPCHIIPGTANTNKAYASTGLPITSRESFSQIVFEWRMKLTAVTGTNVDFWAGLSDTALVSGATNEVLFYLASADTHWQCDTGGSAGFSIFTASGLPAAADTSFHKFRIEVYGSAAGDTSLFFIDDSFIHSSSTVNKNPAAGTPLFFVFGGSCSGVASATMYVGPVTGFWKTA